MDDLARVLVDPFAEPFMQRAAVELVLLGALAGVVGVHVVLRRLAFVTDTLTHTVFPGVVIAFLLGLPVLAGALVAGVLSALLLSGLGTSRRVAPDAALAILLTSFFSLGIVLVSRTSGYTSDLTRFLFGTVLAVDRGQIVSTAVLAVLVLGALAALHKELLLAAFDPEGASAMGYRTLALDVVLNVLVALTVVAAVRAVGTVLVIALLVVPAATAQLLSGRFAVMTVLSCALAVGGGLVGLLASYEASVSHDLRLAPGASVVLALVLMFGAVALGSALARRLRRRPHGVVGSQAPA